MALNQVDTVFVEQAVAFLDDGFRKDGAGIIVATRANGAAISARLQKWAARLLVLDAVKIMRELIRDGVPDDFDFYPIFDRPISELDQTKVALIRIVNELPALAGRLSNPASRAIVTELSQTLPQRYGNHCEFMVDFAETLRVPR